METPQRQALFSWLFLAAIVVLCAFLGTLQYRWIGEVSRAEHERLQAALQAHLNRFSDDFNRELRSSCASLLPDSNIADQAQREAQYAARFAELRDSATRGQFVRGISVVLPHQDTLELRTLDPASGVFHDAQWPAEWQRMRQRLSAIRGGDRPNRDHFPTDDYADLVEVPYMGPPGEHPFRDRREQEWLLIQLNLDGIRSTVIPQLLRRDVEDSGSLEYETAVVMRDNPAKVIYESNPGRGLTRKSADASVELFAVSPDLSRRQGFRRGGPPPHNRFWGRPPEHHGPPEHAGPPPGGPFQPGRWEMLARHRAGSLDSLVAQTRTRNLAVTGGVLLLMIAAAAALVQFTRRAQRLADVQMEFVAGVSHELRTPLSVMRTAGHNLKGPVAADQERVRRYGALIEDESEKLTAIVEQVLRFGNVRAGRVIGAKEAVPVASLIEDVISADRRLLENSHCALERNIGAGLPPILGDRVTLQQALQNILGNAAKYGKGGDWIGITVTAPQGQSAPVVEIRIADRGQGIPAGEMDRIFEPFYRGSDAVRDQIHGTGLGLSLAKRIIEAHDGTITVNSDGRKGAEFIVRIPVAAEQPA